MDPKMIETLVTEGTIASVIDHTLLRPEALPADFDRLCREAIEYTFASICVLPHFVPACVDRMKGIGIAVGTVVGFPLGANFTEVKVAEARLAVEQGARELDMVMNINLLRAGALDLVRRDVQAVVDAAGRGVVTWDH